MGRMSGIGSFCAGQGVPRSPLTVVLLTIFLFGAAWGADPPLGEQALIERDWRMQDGIQTPRAASTYTAAIERLLDRGDKLLADLQAAGVS